MKKKIGMIGVDAGLCWVGDPCYIHRDGKEKPPKDWGKTWDQFFDILEEKRGEEYPTTAQFNYDHGSPGLGVCVSTGFGDGTYPVYANIISDRVMGKRVASITVEFIRTSKKKTKKTR